MLSKKQSLDSLQNLSLGKRAPENCQHKKVITSGEQLNNCYFCGIYISDDINCKTYRSLKMKYTCFMDVSQFSTAMMKKSSKKIRISSESIYLKYRSNLIDVLNATSQKLGFSLNSFYLSIHYLDSIMSKKDNNIHFSSFTTYAIACLMLAAKAVELDERIPYISKMVKYCGHNINAEDFRQAEKKTLELLDWELQICTLFDMVEFYLSQGVLFSNDEVSLKEEDLSSYKVLSEKDFNSHPKKTGKDIKPLEIAVRQLSLNDKKETKSQRMDSLNESHINLLLNNIEYQAYHLLGAIAKDPTFIEKDIKLMAAGIIAYLRKSIKLKSFWNKELVNISNGLTESIINESLNSIVEKFEPHSTPVKKEEPTLTLPKIKTPSKPQKERESYFSKLSHEVHKAANFLLK